MAGTRQAYEAYLPYFLPRLLATLLLTAFVIPQLFIFTLALVPGPLSIRNPGYSSSNSPAAAVVTAL